MGSVQLGQSEPNVQFVHLNHSHSLNGQCPIRSVRRCVQFANGKQCLIHLIRSLSFTERAVPSSVSGSTTLSSYSQCSRQCSRHTCRLRAVPRALISEVSIPLNPTVSAERAWQVNKKAKYCSESDQCSTQGKKRSKILVLSPCWLSLNRLPPSEVMTVILASPPSSLLML